MEFDYGYKCLNLDDCVIVEGSRNFAGREKMRNGRIVNGEGRRNFLVELTPDQYEDLKAHGWDVGVFGADSQDRDPTYFLRVNLSWYKAVPEVHYISKDKSGRIDTILDEAHVSCLDRVNFERLDMTCDQVNKQDKNGNWVKKPYVAILWATVTPDRFRERYSDLQRAVQEEEAPVEEAGEDDGELPF